ncbi:hypothetical protein G6O69_25965 [Pseudenhygromyxa sp. WMMC2535]|uniref:hypothetical protein n=1 Tax=Pseudenhygromyxa sp. WMMC2535 TaxID=2712867 RepID=UPI00155552C2|nr:hypothetical protein [Pseudenhygromyxa sp. WMMC2535]NVB41311.1 hypothetical protein [Pseudenhygromyxa sp. WMMC2535]
MAKSTHKLDALAALLERTGGHPKRIEAVRRAQSFRRSWVELAEVLCRIRAGSLYEQWGYADFHTYCQEELTLKRATVDKLTVSYSTLERHAPDVLERDGIARKIPSYDALDYYERTVGDLERYSQVSDPGEDGDGEAANDAPRRRGPVPQAPSPELHRELQDAVFNEGQPLAELRKRFDPHFFPQPRGAERLDRIKKANALARKLAEILAEIEDLPEPQVRKLEAQLGKLRATLEELAEPLKEKVARARARADVRAEEARASFAEQLREQANEAELSLARKRKDKAKDSAKAGDGPADQAPRKRKRANEA